VQADLLLVFADVVKAMSSIDAERVSIQAHSWVVIEGAHVRGPQLTKVPSIHVELSMDRVTITPILKAAVAVIWNAGRTIHAYGFAPRTDINLVVTLNPDVALRANTVLKAIGDGRLQFWHINIELLQERHVLYSMTTDTIVLAFQIARSFLRAKICITELTNGTIETFQAIAPKVSVDGSCKHEYH
jgi:hypothetical protein